MKKIFVICLCIFTVAAMGVVLYVRSQKDEQPVSAEQFLPSRALVYLRANNLDQTIRKFLNSEFVQALKKIDFDGAMKEVGTREKEIAFYHMLGKQIANEKNLEVFTKLFGREMLIAVYPPSGMKGDSDIEQLMGFGSSVFFVARLEPEARFIEVFTAALSKFNPNFTETVVQYHKKNIHMISVQQLPVGIGYVRFGDYLIFGVGDTAAKCAVDMQADQQIALVNDPVFLKAREQWLDGADQTGYFHYDLFIDQLKGVFLGLYQKNVNDGGNALQQVEEGLSQLRGFEVFSYSFKYDVLSTGRIDMTFDPNRLTDKMHELYVFSPRKNASLDFIPQEALAYSWMSLVKPEFYRQSFKQVKQVRQSAVPGNNADAQLSMGNISGFDPAEIFSLLNGEMGWFFLDMDLGAVPLPKGVFFLGLSNIEQAEAFIKKSVNSVGFLRLEKEDYKETQLNFLSGIPLLANLDPAYCVINNYLIVSPHRETLKRSIDVVSGDGPGLSRHPVFSNSQYAFAQPGNFIFFVEVARLMDVAKNALDWGNSWADVKYKRQESFREGIEKRLENVRADILIKKQQLEKLEQELLEKQGQKDDGTTALGELEDVRKKFEEKKKLFERSSAALQKLKDEIVELEGLQSQGGQRLTESGRKRLDLLRNQISRRQETVDGFKQELEALTVRKENLDSIDQRQEKLVVNIEEQEMVFKKVRGDMRALEEVQTGLQEALKEYARSGIPASEYRQVIIDRMIRPFLEAFTHISWIGGETRMMEGRIRSEIFMEAR